MSTQEQRDAVRNLFFFPGTDNTIVIQALAKHLRSKCRRLSLKILTQDRDEDITGHCGTIEIGNPLDQCLYIHQFDDTLVVSTNDSMGAYYDYEMADPNAIDAITEKVLQFGKRCIKRT